MTASLVATGVLGLAPAAETSGPEPDTRHAAKVELGRRLFMDPAASKFGATSCVSCHDPENGFSDAAIRSQDEQGLTVRHSQGLLDIADAPSAGFHWDGEFASVADLVRARLGTPEESIGPALARFADMASSAIEGEHAIDAEAVRTAIPALASGGGYGPVTPGATTPFPTGTVIVRGGRRRFGSTTVPGGLGGRMATPVPDRTSVRRLGAGDLYDDAFKRAFGSATPTIDRVAEAIEAYVLSLRSTEAPFDRYMAGDDSAISKSAERGFKLFAGEANCSSCHTVPVPGTARAFTDAAYHNTGVAFAAAQKSLDRLRDDLAKLTAKRLAVLPTVDKGLGRIDLRASSRGSFKTPNLRDVARRARYMHDGAMSSLAEVVDYYAGGGTENPHLDPAIRKLDLTAQDRRDLVAFLESLSGDERPGLGGLPEHRPERTRITLRDVEGRRLSDVIVTIRPTGDRLAGTDAMPEPFTARTDRNGRLTFPFPAATHVALEVEGHEIAGGRLVPDCTDDATLLAVPHDLVALEVFDESGNRKRLPGTLEVVGALRDGSDPVTFRRVRKFGDHRAIYAAHASELPPNALTGGSHVRLRDRDSVTVHLHPGKRMLGSLDLRDTEKFDARAIGRRFPAELHKTLAALQPFLTPGEGAQRTERFEVEPPPPDDGAGPRTPGEENER